MTFIDVPPLSLHRALPHCLTIGAEGSCMSYTFPDTMTTPLEVVAWGSGLGHCAVPSGTWSNERSWSQGCPIQYMFLGWGWHKHLTTCWSNPCQSGGISSPLALWEGSYSVNGDSFVCCPASCLGAWLAAQMSHCWHHLFMSILQCSEPGQGKVVGTQLEFLSILVHMEVFSFFTTASNPVRSCSISS